MSLRIKAVVEKFVRELQEALDADIQDRIMKEREMQSYIQEREREVAEREAAWKAELSRREITDSPVSAKRESHGMEDGTKIEAEIARQEARLKMERENLEKEKSVLTGTASNQDNQDGALEITVQWHGSIEGVLIRPGRIPGVVNCCALMGGMRHSTSMEVADHTDKLLCTGTKLLRDGK
ncbi:hypothetical protein MUK42_31268 [Musa troglodytarum]|uniref:Uncharacterized protein n=1 Tax=Musa troglodytarum TaxID=320322 RepID=A0A9E7LE15_9LILI|nr:hypothetical protein MUK42_31268 [Musa troglodytarum]URE47240.1 hypothetical protein MUK42_31268 [Musa troglodytarum]